MVVCGSDAEVSLAAPLFVLASGSPRRKTLLEALGLPFAVVSNPWAETERPGEGANAQVRRLSREKLLHFLKTQPNNRLPVLAADTLLSFRGRPLNKPADERQAWAFYKMLAGHRHRVLTSFVLCIPETRRVRQRTVSTTVEFVPWDTILYQRYLDRGEWRDAAGGYRIQETGSILVRRMKGSWTNVVGLPIAEVYGMIRQTLRVPQG
jgi:septum formation protein